MQTFSSANKLDMMTESKGATIERPELGVQNDEYSRTQENLDVMMSPKVRTNSQFYNSVKVSPQIAYPLNQSDEKPNFAPHVEAHASQHESSFANTSMNETTREQ